MSDPLNDFLTAPRTFVRVYRLPDKLTNGYCFDGGKPITIINLDWFEALISEGREGLVEFIKGKRYFSDRFRLLVIGDDPNFTFIIEPSNVVPIGSTPP